MGLEDAVCPYCGTPNAQAAQHLSDMARFRQEYRRTQADVIEKTSFMQRHGSWLVILVVLLVALAGGIILQVSAWDIGYSMRQDEVTRNAAEDRQVLDGYLAKGDYGKFLGYYDANNISLDYDNPYQVVWTAARSYVDLLEYVSALNDKQNYAFKPDYRADTCGYLADDLIKIYTLEQQYSYNIDKYYPAEMHGYVEDIRERTAVIAKAYYGLNDEQIREIPNLSSKRLATMIEEGISS